MARWQRIGGLLWLACLQYFLAEAVAAAGWPGHYSVSANFISDLGAVACPPADRPLVCSPLHPLFNAALFLQGALITGGALLNWRGFTKAPLWGVAIVLLALSGVGAAAVGLNPEDVRPGLHYLAAAEHFLCCNLGLLLLGVALTRGGDRILGAAAAAAGAAGLAALCCIAVGYDFGLGPGGIERVTAYPFPLAIAAVGFRLFHGRAPA